ncbi:MAG: hypothetical protein IH953_08645 [Chloroflexi bacterium]|nr:hypothetical protein [Chloroflexota bacterium]
MIWRAGKFRLGFVRLEFLSLLAFCVLLAACGDTIATNQPVPLDDVEVPSAAELYPRALAEARAWKPDAHLIWINLDLRPSIDAALAFNSTSDPQAGLVVQFDELDGNLQVETVETKSEGRTQARSAIERVQWDVGSAEAFAIAMGHSGDAFLTENPGAEWWFVNLGFSRFDETAKLAWRIHIGQPWEANIDIYVDPLTGDILETQVDEAFEPDVVEVGDGDVRVPSAHEYYEEALEAAREWRPDAYLSLSDLSFKLEADPNPWKLRYRANSPTTETVYLRIEVIEGQEGLSIIEYECSDPPCDSQPLFDPMSVPIDSREAVDLALEAGGRAFLLEREEAEYLLAAWMAPRTPTDAVWIVSFPDFTSPPGSGEARALMLAVDPVTGEVRDVTDLYTGD